MRQSLPELACALLAALLLQCSGCSNLTPQHQRPAARLIILLVIEQFRYDYLQRYAGYWQGGIGKLVKEGALFSNAYHEHANTECAPGCATLVTGAHPARHGITGDRWREHGTIISCIEDTAYFILPSKTLPTPVHAAGVSPRRLQAPALGDWLKHNDAQAKVVSISGQDRAAVLLGGRNADAAFWCDPQTGAFVTSTYYLKSSPVWLAQWNGKQFAERYRQTLWEKSLPEPAYYAAREDLFTAEADGIRTTFPHALSELNTGTDSSSYRGLLASPFGDELTLEFTQEAIRQYELGGDDHADLLCLSLSATEAIGSAFGPLSQEMQDNLLRLDARLLNFFAWLDAHLGLQNCWIVFTSDHGVLPLPEELRRRGLEAARLSREEVQRDIANVLQEVGVTERADARQDSLFVYLQNGVYLPDDAAASQVAPALRRLQQIAEGLQSLSFVTKAYVTRTLANADSATEFVTRFQNAYYAGRSPDLFLHRKPYYLLADDSDFGTTHGSEYDYDTHVPLLFWGSPFKAGRYDERIATVDLAPTLAHALGLAIPDSLDGKVLPLVLSSP